MQTEPVDKSAELTRQMATLKIREEDIEESFVRAAGHGGQNVNKTSTCVMLLHRPTGIQVKCQTTRHQGQNRLLARELLIQKIHSAQKALADAERSRLEKLRRQKRPRSKAAKARMLVQKAHRARRKESRRPVLGE